MKYLISTFLDNLSEKYTLFIDKNISKFETKKGNFYSPQESFEFIGYCDAINFINSIYNNQGSRRKEFIPHLDQSQEAINEILNEIEIPILLENRLKERFSKIELDIYKVNSRLKDLQNILNEELENSKINAILNYELSVINPDEDEINYASNPNNFMNSYNSIETFIRKYDRGFETGITSPFKVKKNSDIRNELISFYSKSLINPGFTMDDIILKLEEA